jgi:Ca2+-binding RTX toxin-like protein
MRSPSEQQRPIFQPLESRTMLAASAPVFPTAREQQMLELLNRLRMHPGDELPLMLDSRDPDIVNALRFFNVDENQLRQQWKQLAAVPPLAWNDALARTAKGHNQRMLVAEKQSHQLPGEPVLSNRVAGAGYRDASFVGENIFAFAESVEHAHAGFAIDWGNGPYGIQNPPGHRDNLMSGLFHEVGVSMIDAPRGKDVGPSLVTENFGTRRSQGRAFLVGALYNDRNGDECYSPGEGIGGATVIATGAAGTFTTTSWPSGGYQMPLPPGTYAIIASGGSQRGVGRFSNVTIRDDNVKRDFTEDNLKPDRSAPVARLNASPMTSGDAPGTYTFTVTFSDDAAVNAATLGQGDVRVTGPNGYEQVARFYSVDSRANGLSRTATYRINAPGGFFDAADNGTYKVWLRPGEVLDTNANAAGAAAPIGTFGVNTPLATFLANGTYILNGTAGPDAIRVSLSGDSLVGRVNNYIYTFNYKQIKRLVVAGLGGDDNIALARELMGAVIDGGMGNDTLRGSNANDTLQGQAGDDLLDGAAGNDTFRGGPGRDTIFGGKGIDRAERDKADVLTGMEALFE